MRQKSYISRLGLALIFITKRAEMCTSMNATVFATKENNDMEVELAQPVTQNTMQAAKASAMAILPKNFAEMLAVADQLAKTELVPKDMRGKPESVMVALQMGLELGLMPMQAIQSIAVINGRPSVFGDAALAIVMAHPEYAGHTEDVQDDHTTATFTRRGNEPCVRTFTLEDARKARLLEKDTYKMYQRRMLQMRARAWAMRDSFADALKGVAIYEEHDQPERVINPDQPQPKAKAVQEKLAARKASTTDNAPAPTNAVIDGATGEILDADAIMKKLTEAKTAEELREAADLARSIKGAEQKLKANETYRASLKRIRGEK